jgi:P4 family phage/plasmid primase-like protien
LSNILIRICRNSKVKGKYHLFAFTYEKTKAGIKIGQNLAVDKSSIYYTFFVNLMKQKFDVVDLTKSLRMIGATKKEGPSKGVYHPSTGSETIKYYHLSRYSIHHSKNDLVVKPSEWFHDHCIRVLGEQQEKIKTRDSKAAKKFTEKTDIVERLGFILPILQRHGFFDSYSEWFSLMSICRTCGYSWEEFDHLSSMSKGYIQGDVEKFFFEENVQTPKNPLTIGTAQWMLEKASPEDYKTYKKLYFSPSDGGNWVTPLQWKNMMENDVGMCRVYVEIVKDDLVITDKKRGDGFMWSEKTLLWEEKQSDDIKRHIVDILERTARSMCMTQNDKISKMTEISISEQNKSKSKELTEKCADEMEILASLRKILSKSRTAKNASNVFTLVKSDLSNDRQAFRDSLNSSDILLPIKGGKVINLKTGEIRDRTREDRFTFECGVKEGGNPHHPKVLKFFNDVFSDDPERVQYVQSILGYCMSGDMDARVMFCFWGEDGKNGKSVIFKFMEKILGNYCHAADRDVFIKNRNSDRHVGGCNSFRMPLSTSRFVTFSESECGDRLNSSLMKSITGGDRLTCNPKFKEGFTFQPRCKLCLATNHKIEFPGKDKTINERIHYVPFDRRFVTNPNPDIPTERKADPVFINDLLKNHIDDIFAFFIEGSIAYWKRFDETNNGFIIPSYYQEMKEEYLEEMDEFGEFTEQCLLRQSGKCVKATDIINVFKGWCNENQVESNDYTRMRIMTELNKRGYKKVKKSGQIVIVDTVIRLNRDLVDEEDIFGK